MLLEALDAFPGIARGSQGGLLISSCLNHDVEELEISKLVEEIKVSLVVLEVRRDQVVLISLEIKFQDLRDRPGGGCQVERRRQPGLTHDERSQGFQQAFQHGFHTAGAGRTDLSEPGAPQAGFYPVVNSFSFSSRPPGAAMCSFCSFKASSPPAALELFFPAGASAAAKKPGFFFPGGYNRRLRTV